MLDHLRISLVQPAEIPGLAPEVAHKLVNGSSEHWSAITFYDASRRPHVIHNPNHASTRQESDLMHEAAPVLCKHPPATIVEVAGFSFRVFDAAHEAEANWLGGCLQITRDGLLWAIRRGMSTEEIAAHFGASLDMARYRRNMTAVDLQLRRFQSSRANR